MGRKADLSTREKKQRLDDSRLDQWFEWIRGWISLDGKGPDSSAVKNSVPGQMSMTATQVRPDECGRVYCALMRMPERLRELGQNFWKLFIPDILHGGDGGFDMTAWFNDHPGIAVGDRVTIHLWRAV